MLNASWIVIVMLPAAIEIAPPPILLVPDDSWTPVPQTLFAHEGVERRLRSASMLAPDHHLFRSARPTPPPDRPPLPEPTALRVATGGGSPNLR